MSVLLLSSMCNETNQTISVVLNKPYNPSHVNLSTTDTTRHTSIIQHCYLVFWCLFLSMPSSRTVTTPSSDPDKKNKTKQKTQRIDFIYTTGKPYWIFFGGLYSIKCLSSVLVAGLAHFNGLCSFQHFEICQ